MARRRRRPPPFDLVEAAEWVSDRTEVDVEIALELLETGYAYLAEAGLAGAGGGDTPRVVAPRALVEVLAARVPVGEEVVRAILAAFLEFLAARGYLRGAAAQGPRQL